MERMLVRKKKIDKKEEKKEVVIDNKKVEVKKEEAKKDDEFTQIEKLAKMLEKGILTKEEFEFKKKKILGL